MKAERVDSDDELLIDVFFTNLVRGQDGVTPSIGSNLNWWIDGQDTGVRAKADTPEIGANGNWWIGGSDTGKPSLQEVSDTVKIPQGAIIMWSGSVTAIPSGWALCDGKNNTPDLKGRFIVGYDDTANGKTLNYDVIGEVGGNNQVSLEIAHMPKHTHRALKRADDNDLDQVNTYGVVATNLEAVAVDINLEEVGGSKAFDIRPPYYVLAYIMKL